jgi:hypothetical protein
MNRKLVLFLLLVVACMMFGNEIFAQGCSQCRMIPQSSMEAGQRKAAGLNTGIMYLLTIPYLVLAGLFYLFFKDQIKARWKAFRS